MRTDSEHNIDIAPRKPHYTGAANLATMAMKSVAKALMKHLLAIVPLLLATAAAAGAPESRAALAADHDRIVAELIALTEIPAPPFKESVRAAAYAEKFRALGLSDVTIDAEGNVTGRRPGTNPTAPLLAVAAHLDTVFPEGTPIKVRRDGTRLAAPGIGDDTIGLAAVLAWIRALDAGKVVTKRDILFVGNVGEEGPGDLRGVKYLFQKGPYKGRIGDFISFDGAGVRGITNGAVGSRRYRVTFSGPGGHSYGAFGTVNPMVAMADTVTQLYRIVPPTDVKTTYSASVVSGGTSVNSIPNAITIEFDMRSRQQANLDALEAQLLGIIAQSVNTENAARSVKFGSITANPVLIGSRAAGETNASDPLVTTVAAAMKAGGYEATLGASSTDSNVPISMGIPAVTIGTGGSGGRAHALDEFVDVERAAFAKGLGTGLDIIIAAAAIARK